MASYSSSCSYRMLVSISYESPFFRETFKAPFLVSLVCMWTTWVLCFYSKLESAAPVTCESRTGLAGHVVGHLVYTLCGESVSSRVTSRLESVTQIFVVLQFWKPAHLLCIVFSWVFSGCFGISHDISISHTVFQNVASYFTISRCSSLSHTIF
jgi:hypothetical protein